MLIKYNNTLLVNMCFDIYVTNGRNKQNCRFTIYFE